jgi:predicted DNA-binding protein
MLTKPLLIMTMRRFPVAVSTQERKGTAVRMSPDTHESLRTLAERAGLTLTQYLADLVEQERRRVMLQDCNDALARLKADPRRWAVYQAEQRELEGTVGDNIADDDEDWRFLETATW